MKTTSWLTWACVLGSSMCVSASAEKGPISARLSDRSATVPQEAQFAMSATVGKDQAVYHVLPITRAGQTSEPKDYQAANPSQHFDTRFDAQGACVVSDGTHWNLNVRQWGYGDALSAEFSAGDRSACGRENTAAVAPSVSANRVEYRRGALTEWYVNGPLGLQQGFTVNAPPARHGQSGAPLTLVLNLPAARLNSPKSGGCQAQVDADRTGLILLNDKCEPALRYGGLTAFDAGGQRLPAWLETRSYELRLCVDDAGARYPLTIDPFIQQAKLTALDGAATDRLGYSVALSSDGNTAIAGAYYAGVGGKIHQGSAYVFTRSGTSWTQQAKLTASDGAAWDRFGNSVALSSDGNTAMAGASYATVGVKTNQGAAYVFTRSGAAWTQQAKLTALDGAIWNSFGKAVALSGDGNTAIAGAYNATVGGNGSQGAAYVFTRSGAAWTQQVKLIALDGDAADQFGYSVALSSDGNTAIAGAYGAGVGGILSQGAAYVFVRSGDFWTQQVKLIALDGAYGDEFGNSVALSGDGNTAIAGANCAHVDGKYAQGAAYVCTRSGSAWTQQAKLTALDGAMDDFFGISVALSSDGNTAMAGAYYVDVDGKANQGAAYVFTRSGAAWTPQIKLTALDGAAQDQFGYSVALSSDGNTAMAGAYNATVGGNGSQGAAYISAICTLQFAASGYSVSEDSGSVTVTVTRANSVSGAASVNYATASGTASADTDYTTTSGQFTWADGNSENKTITIPILNHHGPQASRSFTVNLSGASGAVLGSPASTMVTITGSDPAIGPTIRANGTKSSVIVNYPGTVSITVEMNADVYAGNEVDWWIVALAGSSWYYLNSALQWIPENNSLKWHPVLQGALFNLPAAQILPPVTLPVGSYTFWFAVDVPMNGVLNLDGPILFNAVNVTVQ